MDIERFEINVRSNNFSFVNLFKSETILSKRVKIINFFTKMKLFHDEIDLKWPKMRKLDAFAVISFKMLLFLVQ